MALSITQHYKRDQRNNTMYSIQTTYHFSEFSALPLVVKESFISRTVDEDSFWRNLVTLMHCFYFPPIQLEYLLLAILENNSHIHDISEEQMKRLTQKSTATMRHFLLSKLALKSWTQPSKLAQLSQDILSLFYQAISHFSVLSANFLSLLQLPHIPDTSSDKSSQTSLNLAFNDFART